MAELLVGLNFVSSICKLKPKKLFKIKKPIFCRIDLAFYQPWLVRSRRSRHLSAAASYSTSSLQQETGTEDTYLRSTPGFDHRRISDVNKALQHHQHQGQG